VLAAARDLFLARGYAGTTVAAVARAAGMSPDTIYVSLGGKQGLLEGVLSLARFDPEDPAQRDQAHRRDEIGELTDPHQRLHRLAELSCQTLARISPVHAVLRGAADGHPFAAGPMTRLRRQVPPPVMVMQATRRRAPHPDPAPPAGRAPGP
jgi:AcrR family transcriptional regulator